MTNHNHAPTRHGDEVQCAKCGKAWAVTDRDPPPCTPPSPAMAILERLGLL